VVFIIGMWVVKRLMKLFDMGLKKASLAVEVQGFLSSIIDVILKFVVILAAAAMLGFNISALLGVFAAAAFAIGLALQGFLGNFASGITIMVFRPYSIGDWVEIADKFGRVESIQIFNTLLVTPGQKVLIIPNGQVTDGIITNFSTKEHIRLELQVTMPYEESWPKVRATIAEALKSVPQILNDPEPEIGIESYDSHNIIIAVRPFIKADDYWNATFEVNRIIKDAFSAANIKVAYSEGVELGPIGN
ncbi:MAG: mechanosensitive ion channel family protein, partial [Bacteroidota bacterium]